MITTQQLQLIKELAVEASDEKAGYVNRYSAGQGMSLALTPSTVAEIVDELIAARETIAFYGDIETYGSDDKSRATGNKTFDIVLFDFDRFYNRTKQSNNTSGFKGVTKAIRDGFWRAQISINGKRKHIGTFSSPEEAHEAYKKEAVAHYGKFARW
jgi:hypothetical protein